MARSQTLPPEYDVTLGGPLDDLLVAKHISSIVLRLAFFCSMLGLGYLSGSGNTEKLLNAILSLLRISVQLSIESGEHDIRWAVTCVFLWTSWQRMLMLYLWMNTNSQLRGFDYESNPFSNVRTLKVIPEIFSLLSREHIEQRKKVPYLCGWTSRLLRNNQANIAMDLRYFYELYGSCFGTRKPNCNPGPLQCDGSSSFLCKRFKGTETTNQSMHDMSCTGCCPRLFWSRDSFISVTKAKAIDISTTDTETLRYCKATEKTLTVSHVWSHGQGGRPDHAESEGTGLNFCLHRRYADLARTFGYESYWMDTPCIPSEK